MNLYKPNIENMYEQVLRENLNTYKAKRCYLSSEKIQINTIKMLTYLINISQYIL